MQEIRYYSDLINDDFADTKIETKRLPENYKYHSKNPLRAIRKLLVYRCLVTPLTWVYNKLVKHISYKNKKCMKGYKNRGCFMYGNHTAYICDAFNPTYISYPRWADVVVNEDTTSIKGIRWLVSDLGAMPIPSDIHRIKEFGEALEESIARKHWVAIYPEAHIWPYYNKIRPFGAVSFRYPVNCNAPVFAYTMTFKKRKHSDKPKITVYIDGPFLPDQTLSKKAAANKLRDEVFEAMSKRAEEYSTYEYKYKYVYRDKNEETEQTLEQVSDSSHGYETTDEIAKQTV
jgi:1-acyl-sn-glycerol-3-phosphate acyltransferase